MVFCTPEMFGAEPPGDRTVVASGSNAVAAMPEGSGFGSDGSDPCREEVRSSSPLAIPQNLAISRVDDTEIIEALTNEVRATGARLEFDIGEPATSAALERWDNEGGAIKQRLPGSERDEGCGSNLNDTGEARRRAKEEERNRLV